MPVEMPIIRQVDLTPTSGSNLPERRLNAGKSGGEWLTYGLDQGESRRTSSARG